MTIDPATRLALAFGNAALIALNANAAPPVSSVGDTPKLDLQQPASVQWRDVELGSSLRRFANVFSTPLWIDRRVDPVQALSLTARDTTVADVLNRVADDKSLGLARLGAAVYLGPVDAAAALASGSLESAGQRPPAAERLGVTRWGRLATARHVILAVTQEMQIKVANPDAIPHDVWDAGETPRLPAGDRLTLLLLGYDLRWRSAGSAAIQIEPTPIAYRSARRSPPRLASAGAGARRREHVKTADRRFTLRLVEQPTNAVFAGLADQLGLRLWVDPEVGELGAERIGFEVRRATVHELAQALSDASNLQVSVVDGRLEVRPLE